MATAPAKHVPQQGAANKVANKAAEAAKGAVNKAGKVASGAAKQAQAAAQAAVQNAAQVTKAAAAKAAVPVAKLAQKLGAAAEPSPKTLKSVDAAEKGVAGQKPLEDSELAFEEEEKERPNRTLICTSFLVYVLFVATCVVFAEYSFQNYDLDPTDIRTQAPPLGTEKDNSTTASAVQHLPLKQRREDGANVTLLDRVLAETEPAFEWDSLRLDGPLLSAEYVPEVLSNQLQRGDNAASRLVVQHASGLRNADEDYIPEILED